MTPAWQPGAINSIAIADYQQFGVYGYGSKQHVHAILWTEEEGSEGVVELHSEELMARREEEVRRANQVEEAVRALAAWLPVLRGWLRWKEPGLVDMVSEQKVAKKEQEHEVAKKEQEQEVAKEQEVTWVSSLDAIHPTIGINIVKWRVFEFSFPVFWQVGVVVF